MPGKVKTGTLVCIGIGLLAMTTDPLQQLNITAEIAQQYVLESISNGNLNYPGTARSVAPALRVEVAKGVAEFAKSYTASALFKTQYTDWWKSVEPHKPPTLEERTKEVEEQAAHDKSANDESVINLKKQISDTKDPNVKKALEDALAQFAAVKQQMETPEMKAMMEKTKSLQKQQLEQDVKRDSDKYNKEYADWVAKKDPHIVIKRLLQQYLSLVKSVDFGAATHKNANNQIVFTDPANERKPSDWKMCFRAGKDVNTVTSNFAQHWLTELK